MINVLIVDPIHSSFIDWIKSQNINYKYNPNSTNLFLKKNIKNYEILILRSGVKLDQETIKLAIKLKLVIRAGSGTDNIDLQTLKNKKIKFTKVPSVSSHSVAELGIGLTLSVLRKISIADSLLRKNIWAKEKMKGYEIKNKNIGFIGYGSITKSLIKILKNFRPKIFVNVENYSKQRQLIFKKKKLNLINKVTEIISCSDILYVCVPLTKKTHNLINKKNLRFAKKNLVIINVSRGGVINESDLFKSLKKNKILGAGLDVFENEKKRNKLFGIDNTVLTPHIGGMTDEAQERIASIVVNKVKKYINK
jgi:D-3-phosphoglycerate dehydrogenase / 2-oxoglutarate reductase